MSLYQAISMKIMLEIYPGQPITQPNVDQFLKKRCVIGLLPLLDMNTKSVSTIKQGIDIVKKTTSLLNPNQTPVVELDEPLFEICKQLQWSYPLEYGEDEIVAMLGGLHIEKAALGMPGELLKGCGWVEMISGSGVYKKVRAGHS